MTDLARRDNDVEHRAQPRRDSRAGRDDTADQAAFREQVQRWHERHGTARSRDDLWAVPLYVEESRAAESFENGRAWQRTLFEHGWAGLGWPREYGGAAGEAWQARVFREVASGYEESSGFISSTIAMLGPTLLRHGTEAQKRWFLPRMLSAEITFCQLFSEPGAGSDLAGLAARAVLDGDEFVVNGQKVWNSQAQFADWGFLLVRTDPDAPKHRGITFLLVDMSSPGVETRPLVQMNGAAHFNEVFLSDVRVPVCNIVGEVDAGWGPARTVLLNESAFIGASRGAGPTASLTELARRRERVGDAVVRQGLADIWARERMQAWMGESIQAAVRRGERPRLDPGLMKLFAAESKRRSGELATAIGGLSVLADDDDPARWVRHELMGRYSISIGGGTNEVIRNNVAERALGLPREPSVDRAMPWRDIPR